MPSVLITGAGRGFGRALVDTYAAAGWTLFPLVRQESHAEEIVSAYTSGCFPIVADVTDGTLGGEIRSVLAERVTALDLLFNNAGIIKKIRGIDNTAPEDLAEHFAVHCVGAFRCVKAALPFLTKSKRPIIVNVTSRRGSISGTAAGSEAPGEVVYPYYVAKAAQNMLTACLGRDLGKHNIRVFAIHPGRLKTAVAPPDADTEPKEAAQKLKTWVESVDDNCLSGFFDLMSGDAIDW